jgi:hypothetical protein
MADKTTLPLCILWEDELRTAARLLAEMNEAKEEEFNTKASAALNACVVALHGLTDERIAVMLAASTIRRKGKRNEPS